LRWPLWHDRAQKKVFRRKRSRKKRKKKTHVAVVGEKKKPSPLFALFFRCFVIVVIVGQGFCWARFLLDKVLSANVFVGRGFCRPRFL